MRKKLSAVSIQHSAQHEIHDHIFITGLRSRSGFGGEHIRHSHPGGSVPHVHPETGPSFYGYQQPKITKRPSGEQLEVIPRTEEENTFELVITDSALIHGKTPIGDTPVEALGFPAAQTMMLGSRLKCIVRDERKNKDGAA